MRGRRREGKRIDLPEPFKSSISLYPPSPKIATKSRLFLLTPRPSQLTSLSLPPLPSFPQLFFPFFPLLPPPRSLPLLPLPSPLLPLRLTATSSFVPCCSPTLPRCFPFRPLATTLYSLHLLCYSTYTPPALSILSPSVTTPPFPPGRTTPFPSPPLWSTSPAPPS